MTNKDIEKLCVKPFENLTDSESNIVLVYTATVFLEDDLEIFFTLGFNSEEVAEAFEEIGHRMAACTVRLAYRVFRSSPSDPALKILEAAFFQMQNSIHTKLVEYHRRQVNG